jgi:hypothetical protein
MSKPEIGRVQSVIKDPMLTMDFMLEFPNIPTGSGDEEPLLIHCQQATKPGTTLEAVEVQVFGHTLEYAGRMTFSHDMSVNFYENARGTIQRILEKWSTIARDFRDQHGEFKEGYARDFKFSIFDAKRGTPLIYTIKNGWPTGVPEIQFSGNESNAVMLSVTFKYDWIEKSGGYTD